MCYFVLIAFSGDVTQLARSLLKSAYHLRETSNPSLANALPEGWRVGFLAEEVCGCNMYADPRIEEPIDDRIERFRQKHSKSKYRKRGWTDQKIQRAVQQITDNVERRPKSKPRGIRVDVRCAIAELAQTAGSVRTLVHFFSGDIDQETIQAPPKTLKTRDLLADESFIVPDVWYRVASGSRS